MAGSPFMFDTDFRQERRKSVISEEHVANARAEGYAQGVAEGEARARAGNDREIAALASLLSSQLSMIQADAETRAALIEEAAVELAVTLARKLGGGAIARHPLADIEQVARECFAHARTAPHLAIRVGEAGVEQVDRLLARLAREAGYAGKIVVLGEPDMADGSARIEWADGGMTIDPARRDDALRDSIGRFFGGRFDAETTGENGP